jgi:hypothetical protein
MSGKPPLPADFLKWITLMYWKSERQTPLDKSSILLEACFKIPDSEGIKSFIE